MAIAMLIARSASAIVDLLCLCVVVSRAEARSKLKLKREDFFFCFRRLLLRRGKPEFFSFSVDDFQRRKPVALRKQRKRGILKRKLDFKKRAFRRAMFREVLSCGIELLSETFRVAGSV